MKRKKLIFNFSLIVTILLAMLFQSIHSYAHLAQQLSAKKCHHTYSSKQEITHQHHSYDHCYVCDFKISTFISAEIASCEFQDMSIPSEYTFFKSREITEFFKGSLFALRAPPIFIA